MNFSTYANAIAIFLGTDLLSSADWLYFALFTMTLSLAINALIIHVTTSIAMFLIAKRNSVPKKWMAFVPFLNYYYAGKLSSKNPFYRIKSTILGGVMASVAFVYVSLTIFYIVSIYTVIPYLDVSITDTMASVSTVELVLEAQLVPDQLFWAYWMTIYGGNYLLNYLDLVIYIVGLFLFTSFFKTYYPRHYFLFSIVSVLVPWTAGILMLVVCKNKPVNYFEFIRSEREKSYRRYQEYYGQNFNNPYNQNPYSNGNPYQGNAQQRNPFDEYSDKKNQSEQTNQNPFDDFN